MQQRLAHAHGSQCGFCTPGFVMSMYSLLRSKTEAPTEEEIEDNLAGNLWCGSIAVRAAMLVMEHLRLQCIIGLLACISTAAHMHCLVGRLAVLHHAAGLASRLHYKYTREQVLSP